MSKGNFRVYTGHTQPSIVYVKPCIKLQPALVYIILSLRYFLWFIFYGETTDTDAMVRATIKVEKRSFLYKYIRHFLRDFFVTAFSFPVFLVRQDKNEVDLGSWIRLANAF